jgi:membrane protein
MQARLHALREWWEHSLPGEVFKEVIRMEVGERALALASKLFVAVIPLSIIVTALESGKANFSDQLILRFGISGEGAAATRELFDTGGQVRSAVSIIGILIVLYSVFSFSRGLQRVYLDIWELPPQRLEGNLRRATWVIGFVVYLAVLGPLRTRLLGHGRLFLYAIIVLSLGTVLWAATPYILLGRRLAWRRLIPTGVVTTVLNGLYSAWSALYLPHQFDVNAHRYGPIGIAFALVSWLFAYSALVILGAVIGGVLDRRKRGAAAPGPVAPGLVP